MTKLRDQTSGMQPWMIIEQRADRLCRYVHSVLCTSVQQQQHGRTCLNTCVDFHSGGLGTNRAPTQLYTEPRKAEKASKPPICPEMSILVMECLLTSSCLLCKQNTPPPLLRSSYPPRSTQALGVPFFLVSPSGQTWGKRSFLCTTGFILCLQRDIFEELVVNINSYYIHARRYSQVFSSFWSFSLSLLTLKTAYPYCCYIYSF